MHIINYTWSVRRSHDHPWQLAGVTTAILTKHAEFCDALPSLRSQRGEADRGLSWPSAAERGAEAADNLARVLTRVASTALQWAHAAWPVTSDRTKVQKNILIIHPSITANKYTVILTILKACVGCWCWWWPPPAPPWCGPTAGWWSPPPVTPCGG